MGVASGLPLRRQVVGQFGGDDGPRGQRVVGRARRLVVAQSGDVDNVHARQPGRGWVDVAGKSQVKDDGVRSRSGRRVPGAPHPPTTARRCRCHDDDVGVGHDRGQVVQARSAHRDAVVRGDVPARCSALASVRLTTTMCLTPRARCAVPSPIAPAPVTTAERSRASGSPAMVLAQCSATDTTEAPARSMPVSVWTRLPTRSALLGQLVQGAAGGLLGVGAQVGVADLPGRICSPTTIESSPAATVNRCSTAASGAHVGVFGELVDTHARVLAEYLAHGFEGRVEGVDDSVDFDAVAGGDEHRLGDGPVCEELVDEFGPVVFRTRRCAPSTSTGALLVRSPFNRTLTRSPLLRR